jgi:hypothetical protein
MRPANGTGQSGARTHARAQAYHSILRKGEAATRYIIARRHIAERHHAPALSTFALPVHAPDRNQGYKGVWLSDSFMVQSRVTGLETLVVTL